MILSKSFGSFSLTQVSGNDKTGPIPVSTSAEYFCPAACPLKAGGCYANAGPLNFHWKKVTDGVRGVPWDQFLHQVMALWPGQLWRHNQAGDLVGQDNEIDRAALRQLTAASKGKRGWTYTHYPMWSKHNQAAVAEANAGGFVVNLSADDTVAADILMRLEIAPVVTILPADAPRFSVTADGHHVIACPHEETGVTCANCGLCALPLAKRKRKTAKGWRYFIIGFRAHGSQKRRANQIARREI